MYRLEITTADNRETLLKSKDYKTSDKLTKDLNYYKSLNLDNIYIRCYKLKNDNIIYLGRFDNITPPEEKRIKQNKTKNISNIIIIIEILLFPIMLIKEVTKRS